MSWINRAESKFGHIAIPGLPRIIVGFNVLVFVLLKLNPSFYDLIAFDRQLVMQGQVWRLATYLFIPGFGGSLLSLLFAAFYVLFLWFLTSGCEEAMGAFKFTWYYITGMIAVTVAAWFFGPEYSSVVLNATLLFAFARFYPEVTILFMMIIPMKIKWVAWITAATLFWAFLTGSMTIRAAILVSLANYLLFFGGGLIADARHRTSVSSRRRRFENDVRDTDEEPLHRCAVCGRTENSAPQLEFRVARDGQEYCSEHLPKAGAPPVQAPPPAQP